MTRECFIVEDGVRYSEVNGARMLSDSCGPGCIAEGHREAAEKYPYLLKSEERGQPERQVRLIDGKLYFLLMIITTGRPPMFPEYEKTYVHREVGENAGPIQKLKRQGEIIGYFSTRVDTKPDSYLLYWHPLKKEMLHD